MFQQTNHFQYFVAKAAELLVELDRYVAVE